MYKERESKQKLKKKYAAELSVDEYYKKIIFPKKSTAGKLWNEKSIKKLIFIVLIMNLGMMIFSSGYYMQTTDVWTSDVNTIGKLYKSGVSVSVIKLHIENMVERYKTQDIIILSAKINDLYSYRDESIDIATLRNSDISMARYDDEGTQNDVIMIIDIAKTQFFQSLF